MARYFIDRPIFAWVLAIIVMLAGALSIATLPIAQYPSIAPPAVAITATYPGASAKTLEDTVTQIIEQKMKGLDHLSYMASTSESSGTVTITLTFDNGTDPDTAQVQVQNKLALATPLLPQEVQQQGVQVTKSATNFLNVLAFTSEDGSMNGSDLSDYVAANVQDALSRVEGVGDTTLFGSQYAMRIWLDPHKLSNFSLTPLDVKTAIQAQNAQVSAGQARRHAGGGQPADQRHHHLADAPEDRRGVRQHPAAHAGRRRPGAPARRGPHRAWAARATAPWAATTASPPPAWPSSWPPAPTRSIPSRPSMPAWPSWSPSSRPA